MDDFVQVASRGAPFSLLAPSRHKQWHLSGYEPISTALFRGAAGHSDCVIDIGAHVGFYALVATCANPSATVTAVEASPQNWEVLRQNCSNYPRVLPLNAAFSDRSGTARIQMTGASDNCGLSGHPQSPTIGTVEVPAVTWGDTDVLQSQRPLIKIDVEGHEIPLLESLAAQSGGFEAMTLLVEFNQKCIIHAGFDPERFTSALKAMNLDVVAIDDRRRRWRRAPIGASPGELVDWLDVGDEYRNLYCRPREQSISATFFLHSGEITGGAERSHLAIVDDLTSEGIPCLTVLGGRGSEMPSALEERGLPFVTVPMPWWVGRGDLEGTVEAAFDARTLAELIRVVQETNPSVAATQSVVIPQGAVVAQLLGIPHVWYLREFGDLDHGLELPMSPREIGDLVSLMSAQVVVNSSGVREHYFASEEAATVLYPAVDMGLPSGESVQRWPLTVAVIGRVSEGKGQELAIRALKLLRDERLDVRMRFVGTQDASYLDRLLQLLEREGLQDAVEFVGALDDVELELQRVAAVVLASRMEAFGRVPFEAARCRTPIVYPDRGGPLEYMIDGTTGLIYESDNPDDLAKTVRRVLTDDGLAVSLGAGALETLTRIQSERSARSRFADVLMDATNVGDHMLSPGKRRVVAWAAQGMANSVLDLSEDQVATRSKLSDAQRRSKLLQNEINQLESELSSERRKSKKLTVALNKKSARVKELQARVTALEARFLDRVAKGLRRAVVRRDT